MGRRRVLEDLREGPDDVGIVVEDLVVIPAWSAVALDEDLRRAVVSSSNVQA